MDLKCKKLDCKYNDKFACVAKEIDVNKNNVCDKYEKATKLDEGQKQNVPKNMLKKPPKLHPFRHSKNVQIKCSAECLFNKEGLCLANGITVDSINKKANCLTYMDK